MNFNEAMQMLGTKLQGKYGHLGFKYKKSDKTLTRHSKNFTYMILWAKNCLALRLFLICLSKEQMRKNSSLFLQNLLKNLLA